MAGVVAIYLLAGLTFASYTILSTIGFGNLTTGSDRGRMLAVVEALVTQLYLVTVVAVIVATHRPRTSAPREEG